MLDVCLIAAVVFAFSLFSRRVEGSVLTAPMVFMSVHRCFSWAGSVHEG
jgi:hypothetical protein